MKTQDVIDLALASGLYQDGEMFFSPATGDADVHISDLEYFAKTVEERTLSKQKAGYYQEGYEAGQHDMFTKSQNVDTSAKRVYASDISATSDKSGISDKADEQAEPWDTSDMAHRSGGLSVEQEPVAWEKSYDIVCALLRQAHDILATTQYPIKRPWVDLTNDEAAECWTTSAIMTWKRIQDKLRSKNT